MRKKYDFVFSIGEACSCTQALRKMGLQNFSYPFDWLLSSGGGAIASNCCILANEFNGFMNKEDFEFSYEARNINCNAYYNRRNGIIFMHDFIKSLEFNETYPLVREKYNRRIRRLLNNIEKSNSVLVVWIESPVSNHIRVLDKEILQGYNVLKEKFGDKIELLYIQYAKSNTVFEEFENGKIVKVCSDYKNYKSDLDYKIKISKIVEIFSKLGINRKIYVLRYELFRFMIKKLVPSKNIQNKLLKFFHI